MKNATMLYKAPGPHEIHGGKFDTLIVDADEVEQAQADGWFLTTPEAKAAHTESMQPTTADNAPPTRAELETKAAELGIAFDKRTADKTLAGKIADVLKA